jgi:hypothetical protein
MPAAPASPAAPGFFTGGNPALGQQATVPGYEWFNGVQEELVGLLARAGVTPSQADLTQLRQSLDRLFGGGLASYSANTTLTVDDAGLVLVDASGGARTIILPAASAMNARPIPIRVVKIDSSANAVTIQRTGTDMIDAGTSIVLPDQWNNAVLQSNGVDRWFDFMRVPSTLLLPTGMISEFPATIAPPGWLKANGVLISRSAYPKLWDYAQASGNLVADATWLTETGPRGSFTPGNGSTTFRIPDLRGQFTRFLDDTLGLDAGRLIGSTQSRTAVEATATPSTRLPNIALLACIKF